MGHFLRLGDPSTCQAEAERQPVLWAACQVLSNLGKGDPSLKRKTNKRTATSKRLHQPRVGRGSERGLVGLIQSCLLEFDRRPGEFR